MPYSDASLETIGAFALNGKALEYLYVPTGDHNLQRPLERIGTLGAIVDWMVYWLQGKEGPEVSKIRGCDGKRMPHVGPCSVARSARTTSRVALPV